MDKVRDRINETILSQKDRGFLKEKFDQIRSVREVGLATLEGDGKGIYGPASSYRAGTISESVPLGVQAALVARASDGKALNFDGGEIWGLCSGCTRRNLILKEEFSIHERKLPLFQRRCNRCVNESRLKLALTVQKSRRMDSLLPRGSVIYGSDSDLHTKSENRKEAAQIADDLGFFDSGSAVGSHAAAAAAAKQMTIIDAVLNGYLDVVIAKLADDPLAGARLHMDTGRNALHELLAVALSPPMSPDIRFHMLACMLEAGQDPNARTMLGKERPLHFAVKLLDEAPKIVQTLLAYGGLHSGLNLYGETPLHVCFTPSAATLLMNAGASSREHDKFGNTPYASACKRLSESQALLEDMEKKLNSIDDAPSTYIAQLGALRSQHSRCLEMVKFWLREGEKSVRDVEGKAEKAAEKQSLDRALLDQQRHARIKKAEERRLHAMVAKAADDYDDWIREVNRGRAEVKKRLADEEKRLKKHGLR
jgi:hypothetical protein